MIHQLQVVFYSKASYKNILMFRNKRFLTTLEQLYGMTITQRKRHGVSMSIVDDVITGFLFVIFIELADKAATVFHKTPIGPF